MAYNNPIQNEAVRPDVGLDRAINEAKAALNEIPWLSGYVFHRAYEAPFPDPGQSKTSYPQVYLGNGEYQDVFFNDNLPATVFFKARGSEIVAYAKPRNIRSLRAGRQISLIFWANLTKIAPDYKGDYIYTESIKKEFLEVLAPLSTVKTIDAYIDEGVDDVFQGFTVPDERRQLAKYPFVSFRIDFTVEYFLNAIC